MCYLWNFRRKPISFAISFHLPEVCFISLDCVKFQCLIVCWFFFSFVFFYSILIITSVPCLIDRCSSYPFERFSIDSFLCPFTLYAYVAITIVSLVRYNSLTLNWILLITFSLFGLFHSFRTPPSPILPPGVGALYSPSASFQSLLANISAAQHQHSNAMAASKPPPSFHSGHGEYLTSAGSPPISPQGHPSTATNLTTTANSSISSGSDGASPTDDRRSSSIAALRLKAREHELRLEMLRQNGHAPDMISWIMDTEREWWKILMIFFIVQITCF